jgi:hypothetical protein
MRVHPRTDFLYRVLIIAIIIFGYVNLGRTSFCFWAAIVLWGVETTRSYFKSDIIVQYKKFIRLQDGGGPLS